MVLPGRGGLDPLPEKLSLRAEPTFEFDRVSWDAFVRELLLQCYFPFFKAVTKC